MGTHQHKTAIIAVLAMMLMSVIAIRAEAQTPTPVPSIYAERADCGGFQLNGSFLLEMMIHPNECGVPISSKDIQLHVKITKIDWGTPNLNVAARYWGPSYYGPVCTVNTVGVECVVSQQSDDDPSRGGCSNPPACTSAYMDQYDLWLNSETSGSLSFDAWYTYVPEFRFPPLPTATPPAGATPTPTPAGTVTPTPTAIGPTPTLPNFNDPNYGAEPTAIPGVSFPAVVSFPPTPQPPVETTPTLVPIQTNLTLTYPTPAIITQTQELTIATGVISDMTGLALSTQSTISDIVSYTNYLSATLYQATLATDTLPTDTAPSWYAPALPRPMADVGWRFEIMSQDVRKRYSLAEWGIWTAQLLALPVQFIKGLAAIAQLMGPFGLLLGWLLVMFPVVLLFKLLDFIKQLLIQIFNFVVEIIRLIGDIWDLFPFA